MSSHRLRILAVVIPVAVGVLAACGNSLSLLTAHEPNVVDTVSLYAIDGTPVTTPSAYDITVGSKINPAQRDQFDFAVNITAAGKPVLLSTGALGLGRSSGLVPEAPGSFDAITQAPGTGYNDSTEVAADSGAVVVIRSRPTLCVGTVTLYNFAKVEVLKVDTVARRIDLKMLDDLNCGYHGLAPGLPKN